MYIMALGIYIVYTWYIQCKIVLLLGVPDRVSFTRAQSLPPRSAIGSQAVPTVTQANTAVPVHAANGRVKDSDFGFTGKFPVPVGRQLE